MFLFIIAILGHLLKKQQLSYPRNNNKIQQEPEQEQEQQEQQQQQQNKNDKNAVDCKSNVKREHLANIFSLNKDLFNEIFEYLRVEDLHSLGQTCKRINEYAGEYFQKKFSISVVCRGGGIFLDFYDCPVNYTRLPGFIEFIPRMRIDTKSIHTFCYLHSHIKKFKSIKDIQLVGPCIIDEKIEQMKETLSQLESVMFTGYSPDTEFANDLYEKFFKYCVNLKYISINVNLLLDNGPFSMLLDKFPKLERIYLFFKDDYLQSAEIATKLVLPRLINQKIFIDFDTLHDICYILFNRLNIIVDELQVTFEETCNIRVLCDTLNALYERGFYKKLFLSIDASKSFFEDIKYEFLIFGLESLDTDYFHLFCKHLQFPDFEDLFMYQFSMEEALLNAEEAKNVITRLVKLQSLTIFRYTSIDSIILFVRHLPKLKLIRLFGQGQRSVVNLKMLNEERAKLDGAEKLLINAQDDIFLATKWATKNGDMNLEFVEMRREE